MYHFSSFLLIYYINISVESSFIPYVVLLGFCTVVGNFVTIDNGSPRLLRWFYNVFTEAVRDLGRFIGGDMDSPYETVDPDFSIITVEPTVSLVLTTAPKDAHDFTNDLLF